MNEVRRFSILPDAVALEIFSLCLCSLFLQKTLKAVTHIHGSIEIQTQCTYSL